MCIKSVSTPDILHQFVCKAATNHLLTILIIHKSADYLDNESIINSLNCQKIMKKMLIVLAQSDLFKLLLYSH